MLGEVQGEKSPYISDIAADFAGRKLLITAFTHSGVYNSLKIFIYCIESYPHIDIINPQRKRRWNRRSCPRIIDDQN